MLSSVPCSVRTKEDDCMEAIADGALKPEWLTTLRVILTVRQAPRVETTADNLCSIRMQVAYWVEYGLGVTADTLT